MRTLKKILHVDDDHDIREITHVSLAQIGGFDVAQCSSVAEAVVKVAEFLPDLLLLDMRLPDGSGISILEELRKNEHFASIPAIFLTGKAEIEAQAYKIESQVIGFIQKPFDPIALPQEILTTFLNRENLA